MNILNNLKLDKWYGIVLYLGTLSVAASLFTKVSFVESKHLFGIGIGGILVGLSFWIAEKDNSAIKPLNTYTGPAALLTWKEIRHSSLTIIILVIGICLLFLFGYLIIKELT
ncbi:MAG: hypothetical protein HY033_01825 [Ignavibacteriae bacterium]|nr:hypothetical protein [Ignavibacteria bacterium]MBI3363626.1 hypothetical protein [Ignavibacteriota bacterium]